MKKTLALLLVICMLACMVTGCASNKETPAETTQEPAATPAQETTSAGETTEPDADKEPSELLVARWAGATADYQKQQVKAYTDAAVTIDDVEYSSLKEKEILSFHAAAGTAGNYDVVWVNGPWMTEYVEAGYIMSIDELAEAAGVDLSIYDQNLLSKLTYDGKLYGIPTFLQCIIGAYDKSVFEEKGLAVPTNYDEMVSAAAALKADGNGIAMPASQTNGAYTVWSQMLYSADGYLTKDGTLAVDSDECIAASERYENLVQYAADGSLSWAHDGVTKALQSKIAAMGLPMSGNCANFFDEENSLIADSVGFFPFYGYEDQAAANQTYWVWAIPSNCKDPAAAFEFIAWLCSYEVEKASSMDMYTISAITELANDAELMATVPFANIVMEQFSIGKPDPANSNFDPLKSDMTIVLSEIGAASTAGGADIQGLLTGLQNKYGSLDWN